MVSKQSALESMMPKISAKRQLTAIVIGSLAWATIWTASFRRSLRVRNTFRPLPVDPQS